MLLNEDDDYQTHDLALAATLLEQSCSLIKLDKTNPRRVVFVFDGEDGTVAEMVADYWKDHLTVNPRTYFDTLKHLKTRIYAS